MAWHPGCKIGCSIKDSHQKGIGRLAWARELSLIQLFVSCQSCTLLCTPLSYSFNWHLMFFPGKIALYTSGVVIGVPMRASAVKGVQASFLGFSMSPTEGTGVSASMVRVYFSHLFLCIVSNCTWFFIVFYFFLFHLFYFDYSDVPWGSHCACWYQWCNGGS